MDKLVKYSGPVLFLFFLVVVRGLFFIGHQNSNAYYGESIQGRITKIIFSANGYPEATINGDLYYFGFYRNELGNELSVGDSIVKESNSWVLRIYKKGNNDPIIWERD